MTLHRASSVDEAVAADGVYRAGGTDLQERVRHGSDVPAIVDLAGLDELTVIEADDDGLTVGALVTVADLATHLADSHPAVALTAAGLATPQIRAVATLGGNLTQRTRCWYFRHPTLSCFKSGGTACPARDGDHLLGIVFDRGPCVHPHPSSLGMALLASDAHVSVAGRGRLPVADLFGDGSDPGRDHLLDDDELLTHVHLPTTWSGERAAYHRVISRFEAEWPLVEAVARIVIDDDVIVRAAVAAGGVATVPLRLSAVEEALHGHAPTADVLVEAAHAATVGATPLVMTRYKVDLLEATVLQVLKRVTEARGVTG
ncbi:MAG TPA: FAD binding domain-containing protein [Euzebyales bacterium]